MRIIETTILEFDELDNDAKQTAYDKWLDMKSHDQYAWRDEVENAITHIEASTQIKLTDMMYNKDDYRYSLSLKNAFNETPDTAKLTGFRAAKETLSMYYQITEYHAYYGRSASKWGGKEFQYYHQKHLSLTAKSRYSAFTKIENCFTGHYDSEVFAVALLESIKLNTKYDYTILDHFKYAFDAFFTSVVGEYSASESYEGFVEHEADQYEYSVDGDELFHRD